MIHNKFCDQLWLPRQCVVSRDRWECHLQVYLYFQFPYISPSHYKRLLSTLKRRNFIRSMWSNNRAAMSFPCFLNFSLLLLCHCRRRLFYTNITFISVEGETSNPGDKTLPLESRLRYTSGTSHLSIHSLLRREWKLLFPWFCQALCLRECVIYCIFM